MEGCSYCKEMKEILEKNNVEYRYVDIDLPDNQDEVFKVFNVAQSERIPVIVANNSILIPDKSFETLEEAYDIIKRIIG
jgi:glutaredoxin